MTRIQIKYCGGCNNEIDRAGIADNIRRALPHNFRFIDPDEDREPDILLVICGCQSGCAEIPENWEGGRIIRIAGHSVDAEPVSAGNIVKTAIERLQGKALAVKAGSREK